MIQAFRKFRTLRIAYLLCILGGFSSGCFFERDHDHHEHEHHHDHDWDEHHY